MRHQKNKIPDTSDVNFPENDKNKNEQKLKVLVGLSHMSKPVNDHRHLLVHTQHLMTPKTCRRL